MPHQQHLFVIYLEDRPGALDRVASLFRRRGFDIGSLVLGASELPGVSRLTVVVHTDDAGARRVLAHLRKLVDVARVDDISRRPSIVRDLALIRVAADPTTRACIVQLAHVFNARVVDVAPDTMVLEMSGSEARIDGLLEVLRPYGVLELVRAGRVAMERTSAGGPASLAGEDQPLEAGIAYSV